MKSVVSMNVRGDVLVGVAVTIDVEPLITAVQDTWVNVDISVTVLGNMKDRALYIGISDFGVIVKV